MVNTDACQTHGNLDGDDKCPEIFYMPKPDDATTILFYREPCEVRYKLNLALFIKSIFQGEELEVPDLGVWVGDTSVSGYDIFPDGFGVLTYNSNNENKRAKYEGWMVNGVMEGYGTIWWSDGSK